MNVEGDGHARRPALAGKLAHLGEELLVAAVNAVELAEGDDGQALIHCHAGCSVESICAGMGIEQADLFPERGHCS